MLMKKCSLRDFRKERKRKASRFHESTRGWWKKKEILLKNELQVLAKRVEVLLINVMT
jgi:hypothetical protein